MPWTLAASMVIGMWLMFTRLTLGAEGAMANADHLIGSLVVTVTITAFAEVTRQVRYLNIPLGAALVVKDEERLADARVVPLRGQRAPGGRALSVALPDGTVVEQ